MKMMFLLSITTIPMISCKHELVEPAECGKEVTFTKDINPLVQTHCAITGCHVAGFPPGDFTQFSVLKAKADEGRLYQFMVELKNMPPDQSLSDADRKKFECWIRQGASN